MAPSIHTVFILGTIVVTEFNWYRIGCDDTQHQSIWSRARCAPPATANRLPSNFGEVEKGHAILR